MDDPSDSLLENGADPRPLTLEEFTERYILPLAKDTAERWLREYGTP